MVTGAELTPRAEEKTCATPTLPGVQTCPRASQVPAQATPLLATVTTEVFEDWYEGRTVMVCPVKFVAVVVNDCVPPRSSEIEVEGFIARWAGFSNVVPLTALLPQPANIRI